MVIDTGLRTGSAIRFFPFHHRRGSQRQITLTAGASTGQRTVFAEWRRVRCRGVREFADRRTVRLFYVDSTSGLRTLFNRVAFRRHTRTRIIVSRRGLMILLRYLCSREFTAVYGHMFLGGLAFIADWV